ncbi:nat [Symbiodinium sp. CCMP2592]|nr:nat [Symbiodinium sp. CCMP2592]
MWRDMLAAWLWSEDAPTLCLVVTSILTLLILPKTETFAEVAQRHRSGIAALRLIILFSTCIARLTGTRGAIAMAPTCFAPNPVRDVVLAQAVDLVFLWLFARLVALMFPGSLKLFQRSTEANYRTEIARHYIINVRQLWMFLRHAAHLSDHVRGVTLDGLEKACAAVNSLACSLRTQEQHEVRLTAEQREVLDSAEDLGQWLHTLQVQSLHPRGQGSVTLPLGEWLAWARQEASRSRMPQAEFIGRSELDAQGALPSKLARLERLLSVMEDLKAPKSGMLTTAMRFLKVPTVGSLNQLRAELQIHYSGQHFWVKTKGGHRLDAMFIPCQRGHRLPEEVSNVSDQLPLNEGHLNPTLIWCNPNAAYYEAMVYQAGPPDLTRTAEALVRAAFTFQSSRGRGGCGELLEESGSCKTGDLWEVNWWHRCLPLGQKIPRGANPHHR